LVERVTRTLTLMVLYWQWMRRQAKQAHSDRLPDSQEERSLSLYDSYV
jgi:hypothetical protein